MPIRFAPVYGQVIGSRSIGCRFLTVFSAFEWVVNMEGLRAAVEIYAGDELVYKTRGKRQIIIINSSGQTVYDNAYDAWRSLRESFEIESGRCFYSQIEEVEEHTNGAIRNIMVIGFPPVKQNYDDVDWVKEGF